MYLADYYVVVRELYIVSVWRIAYGMSPVVLFLCLLVMWNSIMYAAGRVSSLCTSNVVHKVGARVIPPTRWCYYLHNTILTIVSFHCFPSSSLIDSNDKFSFS